MKTSRPKKLKDFCGKKQIKKNLEIYIKSAKAQSKQLDHCLLYGLPGTGKTTLATIIANEMDKKIKIVQGNVFQRPADVINIIATISEGDFLFIDEIHAIDNSCVEIFYSILEDFTIDIKIGKELNSKITRIKIPSFTLVGATNVSGNVPRPLEDRFGIILNLGLYDNDELFKIISLVDNHGSKTLTDSEKYEVAKNSKGVPRIALRLLRRIIDFKTIKPKEKISSILKSIGIYENGLDDFDLIYLSALYKTSKPLGIKTISQITGFDFAFIDQKIEPNLIRNGYIFKSPVGRKLLEPGVKFVRNHS